MSAYLKFFELEQSPFEGKAQSKVVLGTRALREAFGTIQTGLEEGASRICVNGGRGLGKTTLARSLPKLLGSGFRVALVRDPSVSWEALRGSLAKQWGLGDGTLARSRLIQAAAKRRLVLVVDQAELATEDFLDHLDVLLSYRSEDDQPVVQSVLLARLSAEPGESPGPLLWWLDRIQTLQLEFAPLPRDGVESYIHRHLKRAGWRGDKLFSPEASRAIHGYTGGIPGEVSSLCERLLAVAAARHMVAIDADFVHAQCDIDAGSDDETKDVAAAEEPWTLADEFEDLVSEEEFSQADDEPGLEGDRAGKVARAAAASPSLAAAFEHFGGLSENSQASENDEGDTNDSLDLATPALPVEAVEVAQPEAPWTLDGIDEDEDADFEAFVTLENERDPEPEPKAEPELEPPAEIYLTEAASAEAWSGLGQDEIDAEFFNALNAPPTEEELRAIRGGWMAQFARPLAGAAVAAVLGGLVIAALLGGPDASESESIDARSASRDAEGSTRPIVAIEATPGSDSVPLFQAGTGFVDPASASQQGPKQDARIPESDATASTTPQARPTPQTPRDDATSVRGETGRASSTPHVPASPSHSKPDFGWDDLR